MFRITRQFQFCASHHIQYLPAEHPETQAHGHTFTVVVGLETEDERSVIVDSQQTWMRDPADLNTIGEFLEAEWDHRELNRWFRANGYARKETTVEMIAFALFETFHDEFPDMVEVSVSDGTVTGTYRP